MEITPEVKAQLEEQKKQCIFCKIISGEMESKKVFEDDKTISVLDINPILKGHAVYLTKEHYPIMPYIPPDEFKHLFGITPQLTKAFKSAMVRTGINIFVANGGAAGQQAPHFMIHFLTREKGDGFFNFYFDKSVKSSEKNVSMLSNNLPIMMNNHFGRNPAQWHTAGNPGETPEFLKELKEKNTTTILYEDEKSLAVISGNSIVDSHIEIYSKEEEKYLEKLDQESAAHLFYVASFAATAVFEGLGMQGTNIILKSGESDDNPEGKLCLHILPRKMEDGLKVNWEPKQPTYDLDGVAKKIKDSCWSVKYDSGKKEKKVEVVNAPEPVKLGAKKSNDNNSKPLTREEEIKKAIESFID